MSELEKIVLNSLEKLDLSPLKITNEEDFEEYVCELLENQLHSFDKDILIKRQQINNRESRQLKPDISIGWNEILIELKYDIKNLNDIYRLFYQAVKYSRIAKKLLIIFVYDPQEKLTREDREDLESCNIVKVIRIK